MHGIQGVQGIHGIHAFHGIHGGQALGSTVGRSWTAMAKLKLATSQIELAMARFAAQDLYPSMRFIPLHLSANLIAEIGQPHKD